jgi:hypothetical protein
VLEEGGFFRVLMSDDSFDSLEELPSLPPQVFDSQENVLCLAI